MLCALRCCYHGSEALARRVHALLSPLLLSSAAYIFIAIKSSRLQAWKWELLVLPRAKHLTLKSPENPSLSLRLFACNVKACVFFPRVIFFILLTQTFYRRQQKPQLRPPPLQWQPLEPSRSRSRSRSKPPPLQQLLTSHLPSPTRTRRLPTRTLTSGLTARTLPLPLLNSSQHHRSWPSVSRLLLTLPNRLLATLQCMSLNLS